MCSCLGVVFRIGFGAGIFLATVAFDFGFAAVRVRWGRLGVVGMVVVRVVMRLVGLLLLLMVALRLLGVVWWDFEFQAALRC